ncbi:MAG: glycine cleavage T C-terminal barrel domain-containing protein [Alphaproteobacteria bacterium]
MSNRPEPDLLRLPTPFHERTSRASRTNDWVDWNGYTVPGSYEDVDTELWALSRGAGLSDLTPMCKYRIKGPQADEYIAHLVTVDTAVLPPAQAAVTPICDHHGRMIAFALVFRFGKGDYALTCETPILPWLAGAAEDFDVSLNDVTAQFAILALDGPLSGDVLARAGLSGAESLGPGAIGVQERKGIALYATRIGMSRHALEVAVTSRDAELFWDRVTKGDPPGLAPAGWRAREAFRIVQGLPREGVEFTSALYADFNGGATPYDMGLARFVDLDRAPFNGQRALRALHGRPGGRRLVHLASAGLPPEPGAPVIAGRKEAGVVTSSARCPATGRTLSLALVSAEAVAGGDLRLVPRPGPAGGRNGAVRARILS